MVVVLAGLFALGRYLVEKRDFTEYSPTALPKGISLTTSDYYLLNKNSLFPDYIKHLNLNLSLPNSWISESKTPPFFNHTCAENIAGESCKVLTSPKGQQYQITTGEDVRANQTGYEISFIKGGTAIWTTMRTPTGQLDNQDWGTFVDSFVMATTKPTRVIHGSAKGP